MRHTVIVAKVPLAPESQCHDNDVQQQKDIEHAPPVEAFNVHFSSGLRVINVDGAVECECGSCHLIAVASGWSSNVLLK